MTLLFSFGGHETLTTSLLQNGYQQGKWEFRHFPDGESYVRVLSDVKGRKATILCSLNQPNDKILPLVFLSQVLKELGATSVELITPYLSYMRQDIRFHDGECITSRPFAKLLSGTVDRLITIDPHLHRYHALSEIYSIPAEARHAADIIAAWIRENVEKPLIIGPDAESRQWAEDMANKVGCPFTVLTKTRHGDKDVEVTIPQVEQWRDHQPVLVDDIISTARTMIETIKHLHSLKLADPVCIGIHAVFAEDAYATLQESGVKRIVTCNTITHESNAIDIAPLCIG